MAAVHGKGTAFKLDNSGGAIQDLSAYFDTSGLQRAIDTAETTTYGTGDKTFVVGLKSATIPVGGPWDATLDAHMAGVLGQANSLTFEYGPAGGGAGAVKYTGECFVTAYDVSSPVGDVAKWSGTLQVTGAITRTTF